MPRLPRSTSSHPNLVVACAQYTEPAATGGTSAVCDGAGMRWGLGGDQPGAGTVIIRGRCRQPYVSVFRSLTHVVCCRMQATGDRRIRGRGLDRRSTAGCGAVPVQGWLPPSHPCWHRLGRVHHIPVWALAPHQLTVCRYEECRDRYLGAHCLSLTIHHVCDGAACDATPTAPTNGGITCAGDTCNAWCDPGFYLSAGTLQRTCDREGLDSAWSGSAPVCTQCPGGHYCQNSVMTACPAGHSAPDPGASTAGHCIPCQPGHYQPAAGSTECHECPAGSVCPGLTRTVPGALCNEGTWSASAAATCTDCPAGTAINEKGAAVCTRCAAGTAQPDEGRTTCAPCGAGQEASDARDECVPCKRGTFSVSGLECLPCGLGHFAPNPCKGARVTARRMCAKVMV